MFDVFRLSCLDFQIWLRSGKEAAAYLNCNQATISRNAKLVADFLDLDACKLEGEWSLGGDIDLLITSSDKLKKNEAMNLIIEKMRSHSILKETLAKGRKKFMGVISIENGPARHLDIVETTRENYPFALLYFTGSGIFNVKMRKRALDMGYSINEYSMTYKKTKKLIEPELIEKKIGKPKFESEQDIFKFLDMKYKLPTER